MNRIICIGLALCFVAVSCRKNSDVIDLGKPISVSQRQLAGSTDITFLVAADSHFGYEGMEQAQRNQIASMNAIAGTKYPAKIGGKVGQPLGLLLAGDLTDWGADDQWEMLANLYGLNGKKSLLNCPLYECTGNHDRGPNTRVTDHVAKRHGGLNYSWDWQDVHMVCLDRNPDASNLPWLRQDLAKVGQKTPVVIFFHYNLDGPYSDFWGEAEKNAFEKVTKGYNVLGVFHGHWHASLTYNWRGIDAFQAGSPKHLRNNYLVVHITDSQMSVAAWNWGNKHWDWSFVKQINGGVSPAPVAAAGAKNR